jgi:lysophospholipase L1-like esterase
MSSIPPGPRLALLGGAVGAMLALRTASRVAAMRRDGRAWRGLDHRTCLPGAAPALRLAVLGDSAVAGHGLREASVALPRQVGTRLVRRTGRAVEIEAYARSGADTAAVADEQVPQVHDADVVVVGVGVNDALAPTGLARIGRDTTRLLAGVRARVPDAEVVLLTCPDLGTAPGLPRPLAPVVRWRCRLVATAQHRAADRAGVAVVATPGPLPADVFGADGFHPGPGAVEQLAEQTVGVLRAVAPGR